MRAVPLPALVETGMVLQLIHNDVLSPTIRTVSSSFTIANAARFPLASSGLNPYMPFPALRCGLNSDNGTRLPNP